MSEREFVLAKGIFGELINTDKEQWVEQLSKIVSKYK